MPLYETLPKDNVRLLRLLPLSNDHKGIKCQLFPCPLLNSGSTHPYEALSYVWGPEGNQQSIHINDCEVSVRTNLFEALSCLQDRFLERIIWIDALCINQEDNDEKGQQVQCMSKIYARASRVIVWLGDVADQSNEALETIRAAAEGQSVNSATNEAIVKLLSRSWFKRIWVLQEVAAARHILIKSGRTEIDGFAFCSGLTAVRAHNLEARKLYDQRQESLHQTRLLEGLRRRYGQRHKSSYRAQSLKGRNLYGQTHESLYGVHVNGDKPVEDREEDREEITALEKSYGTNQSLGDIIPTIAHLVRGAVFRPRYEGGETSQPGRFALNIRPLSQLVDTYHTRQATDRRDKIYALLGMSSDASGDLDNAGLSPNYQMPWKEVFRNLVKFSTSDQMSVTVWDDREVAVIKGKGYFLGQVSQVKSHHTRDDLQCVTFLWKKSFSKKRNQESDLTFPVSAKRIQAGDVVYFLQGAPKPSIVRLCGSYLAVVVVAIPLPEYIQPITAFPTKIIPVVWDWEVSQGKAQDEAYYEGLIASRREPKCLSTECKCQDYRQEATKNWDLGLILNGLERYEEARETLKTAMEIYGTALSTAKASHGPWTNSDNEALSEMDIIIRELGANAESRDKWGMTPLSQAAASGHESFARLLLDTGGDVDAKDYNVDGRTPLHHAIDTKREDIVRLLLDKGASINGRDGSKNTPLWWAAASGHETIVRLLLDKGADISALHYAYRTPVWVAVELGHETVVRLLLEKGARVYARDRLGTTLISLAAANGHKTIVRLLLDKGINVDMCDEKGKTPLSWAAANRHENVARFLLDKGAKIDAGHALSEAAMNGHESIVRLLLDKGADIDIGYPLSKAAENGHESIVRLLLDMGADVNACYPLLEAAMNGHESIVRLLLDKGADIDDRHPLSEAAKNGHESVVRLLLDKGADIDAGSPLLEAAKKGNKAIVQLLREKGAAIDPKNRHEVIAHLLLDDNAKIDTRDSFNHY